MKGRRTVRSEFNIICCTRSDVVLITENDNDLHILVYNFNKSCQKYNMKIAEKTKLITISHDPLRGKLVISDRIVEQIIQIGYLGTRLTSNSRTDEEVVIH